jgi:alkylation response protein AidB-like acyl-CoA dehydrogenase
MHTDEQRSLREALRRLLSQRSDSAAVRAVIETEAGYDKDLWRTLCEQIGVAALAVPDQYGGAGASLAETHVVMEELGRALTPTPLLGSGVLAAQLLLGTSDVDACARLLPRVAAGEVVAVAWADERGWHDGAVQYRDGRLYGTAHYVLDGAGAAALLVVTTGAVVEVEPAALGVRIERTEAMDATRRLARIEFDGVGGEPLSGDACAGLRAARDAACVALSAEQVGAAARVLELTVEYSKVRVQFGRPIGSFQALKHRMADLHVLVESARSASYAALDGSVPAAVAKAYCSEAFETVAGEAIQLHGGIAITWEHDAHLYFKRAHASAQLFGAPGEHIERVATLIGMENR